ncbi:hypothetical protein MUG78_17175 [Gordonia alkaliphila]|uniref:hypothetical protein n=1 Tax=Gordonia alkaliphila TaxID=1053547 RepID=UPI001FF2BEAF|nr:hypothetical protein [Gordonia alkaliphila]MCK0441134.1 hypothetical protein [Gordonia alkaliphila]
MAVWNRISSEQYGKLLRWNLLISPLLLILTLYSCSTANEAANRALPDVQREVTINNNIRFFVGNFLDVYFGGSGRLDSDQLAAMVADGVPVDLPVQPMTVEYTNIRDVQTLARGQDSGLYSVSASVTLTAPGAAGSTRNTFVLEVVRAGESYAVAKLPELTAYAAQRVQSSMTYLTPVSTTSPLGEAISNFAGAYYVSANSASLGRFVTSGFKDEFSIADSPYTAAQVVSIMAPRNLDGQPPTGDETVSVVVTFKGVVTNQTFNLMQTMLKMKVRDGKWVVDGIGARVPIDGVKAVDPAATPTTQSPLDYTGPKLTPTRPYATPESTPTDSSEGEQDDDSPTEPSGR